ncbi:MAG: hypothetical protein ACRC9L_08145 [Brevinema sp.]
MKKKVDKASSASKKEGFQLKYKDILKKLNIFIKDIAEKTVVIAKKCISLLVSYVNSHKNIILKISLGILSLVILLFGIHFWATKPFYYGDRLNSNRIITERMSLRLFSSESDLQAYIRQYFLGNDNYQIRLPYNSVGRMIGIYHDTPKETLIINWNSEFYLSWQEGVPTRDTQLFFYSIKRNFPVKTIRYLIDGRSIPILWEEQRLDLGVNIESITIQKNKKN